MEVLNDILETLKFDGALYFRTQLKGQWAVEVPPFSQAIRFHLILSGECHIRFLSGEEKRLSEGELILVPAGASHILYQGQLAEVQTLPDFLARANYDGRNVVVLSDPMDKHYPNKGCQMLCGHFNFRDGADHPLIKSLPDYMYLDSEQRSKNFWLDELLSLISIKAFSEQASHSIILRRLSEVMFVAILEHMIEHSKAMENIGQAFKDARIAHALALMHQQPELAWSVDGLARAVGMSRSRFAERFRVLIGVGPMAYLSDWRLQKAIALLEDTNTNAQQVAYQTGYKSAAAFSRAFSSKFGFSPRQCRERMALD